MGNGSGSFHSTHRIGHKRKGEFAHIRAFFVKYHWYPSGYSGYLGGKPDHPIYNWEYINIKNEVITINIRIFDERKYKDVLS